jgi:hypothetical protein
MVAAFPCAGETSQVTNATGEVGVLLLPSRLNLERIRPEKILVQIDRNVVVGGIWSGLL